MENPTLEKPAKFKLPELVSAESYVARFKFYPFENIGLARTYEEFAQAIDGLTSSSNFWNPDLTEAIILAIKQSDQYEPLKARWAEKLIKWYGESAVEKDVQKAVRAFRFLTETSFPGSSIGGNPINRHICSWDNQTINGMVKRFPSLYWFSDRYLFEIDWQISYFVEGASKGSYDEGDWQKLETAIRRILKAGDWSKLSIFAEILKAHQKGIMRLKRDNGIDLGDPFLPGRIRSVLKDTVRFLAVRKNREEKGSQSSFKGLICRELGLRGGITISVCPDLPMLVNGMSFPCVTHVDLRISVRCQDDWPILHRAFSYMTIYFSIEGGFIGDRLPDLTTSNGNSLCHTFCSFPDSGEICFTFMPVSRRYRLNLELSYDDGKGCSAQMTRQIIVESSMPTACEVATK